MKTIKFFILVLFLILIPKTLAFDMTTLWNVNSYVIDTVWILNQNDKNEIEAEIENLRKKYTTEILTIIIPSTNWEDISSVATEIWQKIWVWKSDKDNWVVILIAINDRTWNIATGYWVEWVLPDLLTKRIGESNFIQFREKKYKEWIIWALHDFDKAFSWDKFIISTKQEILRINSNQGQSDVKNNDFWIILLFSLIISLLIWRPLLKSGKIKYFIIFTILSYLLVLFVEHIFLSKILTLLEISFFWLFWYIGGIFWKIWWRWGWFYWGGSSWGWGGWFGWWSFGWGGSSWKW
jgi:uncharacterized protein